MAEQKLLSAQQISEHKTPEDCWIVVDKKVWDVTDFLDEHPGGSTSTSPDPTITLMNLTHDTQSS